MLDVAVIRRLVARDRRAQGLPPRVEEATALRQIAVLTESAENANRPTTAGGSSRSATTLGSFYCTTSQAERARL